MLAKSEGHHARVNNYL